TSGPWGDPDFHGDVTQGLPPLRGKWIGDRGDVEEYEGRKVQPIDDGFLSEAHAAHTTRKRPPVRRRLGEGGTRNIQHPTSKSEGDKGAGGHAAFVFQLLALGFRSIPGAKSHPVTQFWCARHGIITSEMEFIAIRENMGRELRKSKIGNPKSETHSKFEIRNSEDSFSVLHSTFGCVRNYCRLA